MNSTSLTYIPMTTNISLSSPELTKKQRQALRREAKLAARTAQTKQRSYRRLLLWVAVIIGVGLVGWLVIWAAGQAVPGPVVVPQTVVADDWIKGSAIAPLVLVEYSDFQCPACARYQPTLTQLKATFGEQLAVVYRHFPLTQLHPHALLAAQAAEAAGKQGKFWEMHDLLFARQNDWSALADPTDTFVQYAQELELDQAQFSNDVMSAPVRDKVNQHLANALAAQLPGTPSFFLNGVRIDPPATYDGFAALLTDALGQ